MTGWWSIGTERCRHVRVVEGDPFARRDAGEKAGVDALAPLQEGVSVEARCHDRKVHSDFHTLLFTAQTGALHLPAMASRTGGTMRNPKDFFKPMAIGAPAPVREIPFRPSRMIHFFDPSNPKMAAKAPSIAAKCDVILGNLEDAVQADKKTEAREGFVKIAKENDFGDCQLWTRVNSLDSPWFLDDMQRIVEEVGDKVDVIMVPKVEGPWDIHYVDRLLAQLEARAGVKKPILVHAILETALGVANVEEIAGASPRMQGLSLGPADLAASRRMKTTRVGGGHPGYLVRQDPDADNPDAPRTTAQQDLWHYTIARMVDACVANGIFAYYGPFGDIRDTLACEDQFRNAFLLGCVGAWSLHPVQIDIAKKVFSPPVDEVLWAKKVIESMGDGSGAVMIDGKMQDDATYKQCQVMVGLARMLAEKDADLKAAYQF
jgi:malyl-CoA/(S)-citramalyl-CoA lyase